MSTFTNSTSVNIHMTHLQGSIVATRREIEAVFGAPTVEGEFDKTTTEWRLQFDDGTVATIYDWKRYDLGAPAMDERITWNIGGHAAQAYFRVADAMLSSSVSQMDLSL